MRLAQLSVRMLLLLYPRQFRSEFASEMLDVFEDRFGDIALRCRSSTHRGVALSRLLLSTWANIVVSAISEHIKSSQVLRQKPQKHGPLPAKHLRRSPTQTAGVKGTTMNSVTQNMSSFAQDIRSALREIRRDVRFYAFAALIIGLGVGANTAVFSVMSPLLIRPLPFDNPDQLVWVARGASGGMSSVTSRTSNLRDFRAMNQSFEALTGYDAFFEQLSYNLVGDGVPERLAAVRVAQNFLDVLGVQPLIGRNFVAEESIWDGRPAAILTHPFWVRHFGADPSLVGRSITLNDIPTEVVGILPASFDFSSTFTPGSPVDFILPFPICDETDNWGNTTAIIGRMKPGVTADAAQAELDVLVHRLQDADPERWGLGAVVTELQEKLSGGFRSAMFLLAAAAGAVMLIACANLSNLLLARGSKRYKEMAIRSVLGGSRKRLVRQLLMESLFLSFCGAGIGIGIAYGATELVAGTTAVKIPMLQSVSVDSFALLFTLGVAVVAGILIGIVPALQMSEGQEAAVLNDSSRGSSEGKRSTGFREALVVLEVAIACILLVGGGLLLRSFTSVLDVNLGFGADGVVAWRVDKVWHLDWRDRDWPGMVNYYDQLVANVEAVPGVEAVGLTDCLPLGWNRSWTIRAMDQPEDEEHEYGFFPRIVDFRYLSTMGIPLVAGRNFTADDTHETTRIAVINKSGAARIFPGQNAVGRTLLLGGNELEVVGVVDDVRHQSLEQGSGIEVYFLMTQRGWDTMNMVVRSPLPAEALFGGVSAAIQASDPAMPTGAFQTLNTVVDRAVSPRRFTLLLLSSFAGTALLLAALGIYGVLSYSVSQRIPEIGIRMALGETGGQVLGRVVARTMTLAAIGVAIGAAGSFAVSRLMGSLLYGVEPTDAFTFISGAAILLSVAAFAGFLPARRASKTDPMVALRSE
jgi:predicted permease